MASWTTFFILKRIGNWKTSSFSFSKCATLTLQAAITLADFEKSHIIVKPSGFNKSKVSFFSNQSGVTFYFLSFLVVFFFSAWFQRRKIAVFWPKFTISRVSWVYFPSHITILQLKGISFQRGGWYCFFWARSYRS